MNPDCCAGRYEIGEPLGAGGMGVIYRAHDLQLDRDVALKFLSGENEHDENSRLRLLREARTVAALNHPNIGVVHEVSEDHGRLFMVMELVSGESLQRRIGAQGLPPATVTDWGIQIADALQHAHSRGVVHRDLKSANVMVTPEGRIKVLDFGIARMVADAVALGSTGAMPKSKSFGSSGPGPTLTLEGTVLGTPQYLPPEVVQGRPADARSDLWSLGVLLYEMVSGRLPFPGGSIADLALAIVNREPEPLPATVPAGLRSVILRCLAKDPDRRYQNASEVRAALEAVRDSGAATIEMPAGARRRRRRWPRVLMAAGVLVSLGSLAVLALTGHIRIEPSESAGNIRSLAVLPLANLSGDASQDYFADGMTEELITRLAAIDSLKVISRTSVMQYRGTARTIPQIARELGVDGIVEGSVVRAGDRVKITAQLIDAARDRHLWAESYERDMHDVLALQSEVAQDIAARVRLSLTPEQRARMAGQRIDNPEAYENYLQGRAAWNQASVPSMRAAIRFFERAIALDSTDARSYAGLADAYLLLTQVLGAMTFDEGLPKVREYAERALALDPDLAEANTSKAIVQIWIDHDWAGAERSLQRSFQINPGYAPAYIVHATLLGIVGEIDRSVDEAKHAVELDPRSTIAHFGIAWQYLLARRYDEALAAVDRIHRMDPSHVAANSLVARIYELRGELAKAVEVSAVDPGWSGVAPITAELRRGLETGGPRGYWEAYLSASQRTPPARRSNAWMAYAELQLGNRDQAFYWLRLAHRAHEGDMLWLRNSPLFDKLHGEPRFDSLLVANHLQPIGSAPRP
jgi:TolB-like protein